VGDVVVDLTDLRWADPSLMVDFAILSRHLRLRERRLRLHGARPDVHRLIERVGLHRLPGVHFEGPAAAMA
jgi:anti-anti-sigma regulatory factor